MTLVIASTYVTWFCISSKMTRRYWEMYVLGLRSSWGTSRVRPAWSPSGHILTPALSPFWGVSVGSHACPEDAVYSLNDSYSYFTNIFSLRELHAHVQKYLIIILAWYTFILYITFLCTFTFILYITFICTIASSFLHLFCFLWQAGSPQFFVSDIVVIPPPQASEIK
jgi:uncharacterized membrane protein